MNSKMNIQISRTTKEKLNSIKLTQSETYDEVITRLLETLNVSNEIGFELTNGLFKISCEADFEEDHWYFLDELGNQSEFLHPTQHFIDEGIQKEYESFIKAINTVSESDLNLLAYGAGLKVGEAHQFDGFTMKRTY